MIKIDSSPLETLAADMVVIPIAEDMAFSSIDAPLRALIEKTNELSEFNGKFGDEVILYESSNIAARRVLCLGLGALAKVDGEVLRKVAGQAVNHARKKELNQLVFVVSAGQIHSVSDSIVIQMLVEGALLGNYRFECYKKEKKSPPLKEIIINVPQQMSDEAQKIAERTERIINGTLMAREWVSSPPNNLTPIKFKDTIVALTEETALRVHIMPKAALVKKKFGALLAVASGSQNEPVLLTLEYPGQPNASSDLKTIVLVGKGVTYDAGGLNLKTAEGLSTMKIDMAGAAAVAATLITAARLSLTHRIIGVLPLAENMPSGSAYRPGDVITAYGGKTIEIGNTDAEGRLLLADAITYAIETFAPDILIDLATLTGACMTALGNKIAGVFANDDALADALLMAGEQTHERCWRLPMPEDYKEFLKSDVADIRNIGSSPYGGAITGALFLQEFIEKVKWAHIDLAGPAYTKKDDDYCPAGGTGFGARLLIAYLDQLAAGL